MIFKIILIPLLTFCLTLPFVSCSSSDDATDMEEAGFIHPTIEPEFPELKSSRLQVDDQTGKVNWTSTDQLLVFVHEKGKQPASITEWQSYRYRFVLASDPSNTKFVQESSESKTLLLDPTKEYDWYVMYPYNETVTSPLGDGFFTIADQTMDMNSPSAHLGAYDVMSHVLKGQKAEKKLSILLDHRATLMQFTVHNLTSENFTPQYLEFETQSASPSHLSGDFKIDFEKGLTVNHGKNTIRLNLDKAQSIAPNTTFKVSAIMSPFSLASGDQFKIRVVTDKTNTLQTSTMKKTISFQAGTRSSANVKVTDAPIINQEIEGWGDQGYKNDNIII